MTRQHCRLNISSYIGWIDNYNFTIFIGFGYFKKKFLIAFMIIIRCWILFVFLFVVTLLVFVFGYFQKLNIIHIFIQSFFKSWILSFFQSRKHYSLISENNSFRILPPIHISRFWTCVSTPMDQRNKQKSMKRSKTYQTYKNGPMQSNMVQSGPK